MILNSHKQSVLYLDFNAVLAWLESALLILKVTPKSCDLRFTILIMSFIGFVIVTLFSGPGNL